MKARIKGTNTIVECIETGTFINHNKGIECRHSNGAIEVIPGDCLIEIENDFDWPSFRAEAAKDILCSMIQGGYGESRIEYQSKLSVTYADELVKQLKEKKEK